MSGNPFSAVMETISKESAILDEIRKAVKALENSQVYIGIPKESSERNLSGGVAPISPINNAHLLYIHSYGSPVRNIPSREVLEPAMKHNEDNIVSMYQSATIKALEGKLSQIPTELEKIGIQGANFARSWFTSPANGWKPITEKTIEKKGSDLPLIDTSSLRKAITHVVDKKGARR